MTMRTTLPLQRPPGRAEVEPFGALQREMNRLFEDFFRGGPPAITWPGSTAAFTPRIEVRDTDEALVVSAELPGVAQDQVEIEIGGDVLTIRGEKKVESETKDETGKDVIATERSYGSFLRTVALPFTPDSTAVTATFDKGVLTVTLPKPPEAAAKAAKIAIKAA